MRDSIADILGKLLLLHRDLTVSDLAKKTGIPQPTLHHILEAKTKKPRQQALEALAKFFSISIPQLTGEVPFSPIIPEKLKKNLKISTVPLIQWHEAYNWNKNQKDLTKFEEIILTLPVGKNAFALKMPDSSMEPIFQEQSLLIFDPIKIPKERDFVLVYFGKTKETIFNRLFIDRKNTYIKKENDDGDIHLIKLHPKKDKIIATLVEARLHF